MTDKAAEEDRIRKDERRRVVAALHHQIRYLLRHPRGTFALETAADALGRFALHLEQGIKEETET